MIEKTFHAYRAAFHFISKYGSDHAYFAVTEGMPQLPDTSPSEQQ